MSSTKKSLQQPPVIKEEPGDFQRAQYKVSFIENDQDPYHIRLNHNLSSGNLVRSLIDEGKASYGCEIISPRTFYRELELCKEKLQELRLNSNEVHLNETILRPLVVSTQQATIEIRREHGLHQSFEGYSFNVEKGTILADGGYFDVIASEGRLFSLHEDVDLDSGIYALVPSYESGFHFEIRLAPDLHKNFNSLEQRTKEIFLTGILASSLEYIGRLHQKDEEFLEEQDQVKQFLVDLAGNHEDALRRIKEGEAAKMASTYRKIKMIPDHER